MTAKPPLLAETIARFICAHHLPSSFKGLAKRHYLPLADWLRERGARGETSLVGINGAQGTGKSTLAALLELVLESAHGWRVAVLSIDDFYLTKAERLELANRVHPLLGTRGVPGTHDIPMLQSCLEALRKLKQGHTYHLPRFDKAKDDRADESTWPSVSGPVDLIILEGWCVGSIAQSEAELVLAVNELEGSRDPRGEWRRYVNERLASEYEPLFARLDALIFLAAPSFDAIYRWRVEQEAKLKAAAPEDISGIMTEEELAEFIQYYERITRHNLAELPSRADVVLELDENHDCVSSPFTER